MIETRRRIYLTRCVEENISLKNIEELLDDYSRFHTNGEEWLIKLANDVSVIYKQLRDDIRSNENSWSYHDYCIRLAFHYYNVGSCYNDVFIKKRIGLSSVLICLENCLEKISDIPNESLSAATKKLKEDAENSIEEVKNIFDKKDLYNENFDDNHTHTLKSSIYFGDFVKFQSFQCFDDASWGRIMNIQLIWAINQLEESIAIPVTKSVFIIATYSKLIAKAYNYAKNSKAALRYDETAQSLFTKCMVNSEIDRKTVHKHNIENIIREEIKEYETGLSNIKSIIEKKYEMSLSGIDCTYINEVYLNVCIKFFLEQVVTFLKDTIDQKNYNVFKKVLPIIGKVSSKDKIPDCFKSLPYYALLNQNYSLIDKDTEIDFLDKFESECVYYMSAFRDFIEKELKFFEAFVDFFNVYKNTQWIVVKLRLHNFFSGNLPFKDVLTNIVKCEDVDDVDFISLKKVAEDLLNETEFFLTDELREVVGEFIKGVEIYEKSVDGRIVIEVTGRNIIFSEIEPQIRMKITDNPSVEEVRIVGANILNIDANIDDAIWYGKNLVIIVTTIKINETVVWNVSGKNAVSDFSNIASTDNNGDGKPGIDGGAGESGGNVLILAKSIDFPNNFTIISNGGDGAEGQEGGKGADGSNGSSLSAGQFIDKFPRKGLVTFKFPKYRESIENDIATVKDSNEPDWNRDVFKHIITNGGNEIIFSVYNKGSFHILIVYKGSLGKPGGCGGQGGLGGEGGFAGEITVKHIKNDCYFDIVKNNNNGQEGKAGKGGIYGKHGKNGWDMAYLDYSPDFLNNWPKIYGNDENSKLTLEFNDDSSGVWCEYKKKYGYIVSRRLENVKLDKFEERNTTKKADQKNRERATRKKAIPTGNILDNYTSRFNSAEEAILQNLKSDFSNVEQRLNQFASERIKQREKKSSQKQVKRNLNYRLLKTRKQKKTVRIARPKLKLNQNKEAGSDLSDNVLEFWVHLKSKELVYAEIKNYFSDFESLQRSVEISLERKGVLKMIETLLIQKCRTAVLVEIDKKIMTCVPEFSSSKETPEKYLFESGTNANVISHSILGTINQYFHSYTKEEFEKISTFLKETEDKENIYEALTESIKKFISEKINLSTDEMSPSVAKYCTEYASFCAAREENINIFYAPLESELFRLKYMDVACIGNFYQDHRTSAMLQKINQDKYLKGLYKRFSEALKLEYNWSECFNDQDFMEEHSGHIQEEGPASPSYRELLACIFNVNINVYGRNDQKEYYLVESYNSSATNCLHFYLTAQGEFKELDVNENYFKLEKQRQWKNDMYAKILSEIELLDKVPDILKYFESGKFFSYDEYLNNDSFYTGYPSSEKEDIKTILSTFNVEHEKIRMQSYLEKISSEYIGNSSALYYIAKRLAMQDRLISFDELFYLIGCVLNSAVNSDYLGNIFSWVVTICPQTEWMARLMLLRLESFFRRSLSDKAEWMNQLVAIKNVDILMSLIIKLDECRKEPSTYIECIDTVLRTLSCIPTDTIDLDELGLTEWPYALREKYWEYKLMKIVDWSKNDKLPLVSYYVLSLENTHGESLVGEFLKILEHNKKSLSPDKLYEITLHFYNENGVFTEEEIQNFFNNGYFQWFDKMFDSEDRERDINELVKLITKNSNTSPAIREKVTSFKIEYRNKKKSEEDIKTWVKSFKSEIKIFTNDKVKMKEYIIGNFLEILSAIDGAIELKRNFRLRNTQKLSVLTFLNNNSNTLAQISTGEGKSLIVVTLAIIKALCGERVDVVTSSPVLAKRDASDNRDIYELFDVKVSHNCIEDIDAKKNMYSSNQVVYGDLSNFQRDYLLDRFYGKNILGNSSYDNIIVDEVDSMLLDKGNNVLYLSHDLPGLDKLESVYVFIWQWINRPAANIEQIAYTFDSNLIRRAVLSNLYTMIDKEDVERVCQYDAKQSNRLWECLINEKVIDERGKLLSDNFDSIKKIVSRSFAEYTEHFIYLLKTSIEAEKYIRVPEYLKPFVELHLDSWITNAKIALFMKDHQDYIVDVDRTGQSLDRNPNVIILDKDTGADQANSQWDKALHQFLQLKHGCRLSMQSLKAVFISNVSFIKLYKTLYGLTGTLGSMGERELLKEIYSVDFVTIPTAKCKQFFEEQPIVCNNKDDWIDKVAAKASDVTKNQKRSNLIICETIDDVESVSKAMITRMDKRCVHTYTRDYEEFDIIQNNEELEPGHVIIATNLAGRGTDIKISKAMINKGGLHVSLTYLPTNVRIEQQAFGRAARCGEKGSGQLIVVNSEASKNHNHKILEMKKQRDGEELYRISGIKAYYENRIMVEEKCFRKFQSKYEELQENLKKKSVSVELRNITTQSCLDKWAFWLDKHSSDIDKLAKDEEILNEFLSEMNSKYQTIECVIPRFMKSITEAIQNISPFNYSLSQSTQGDLNTWCEWIASPFQILKLAKYFVQNKRHEEAIVIFDKLIKLEPHFCEGAYYYKAHALSRRITRASFSINSNLSNEIKSELHKASVIFNKGEEFILRMTSTINKLKQTNTGILQIEGYEEQQKNINSIVSTFSNSIDDIIGHSVSPQSFVCHFVNENLSQIIYEDLLQQGILRQFKINQDNLDEPLRKICFEYGIDSENLRTFLTKYTSFDETTFKSKMKECVTLPSRELFWKQAIDLKIFNNETKYVIVNVERLNKIDPSLVKFLTKSNKTITRDNFKSGINQIILYPDQITQLKDDCVIFIKGDILNILNAKSKYQKLKSQGVFKFNKKADVNIGKDGIENINFPLYDSVVCEDFEKHNIGQKFAEEIINELVKGEILKEKISGSKRYYSLNIQYSEISDIEVSSFPIYEAAVKTVMHSKFAYRIAFQEIIEKSDKPSLSLFVKPHNQLIGDLIFGKIIKPVSVTTETRDFEDSLNNTYKRVLKKENIEKYLEHSKLIPQKNGTYFVNLVDDLIAKKWILKYNIKESVKNLEFTELHKTVGENYVINTSFIESLNVDFRDYQETIQIILENYRTLAESQTQQFLQNTLIKLTSDLDTIDVPEFRLKSLPDCFEKNAFSKVEDIHVFQLNGVDEVIQLEGKKWTLKTILKISGIILLGLAQIAIGVVIELYSAGLMTHVGGFFIGEGISDLMFACGSLISGHFSWKDYWEHKKISVVLSVCTAGIAGFFSKGVKVSQFGSKLIKPGLVVDGVEGCKATGKTLMKCLSQAAVKEMKINIWKEVGKRIILKGIEGVAFGMTNVFVDRFVDNVFDTLCKGLLSSIMGLITSKVDQHNIKTTLRTAYDTLGEKTAMELVETVLKSFHTSKNKFIEKLLTIAKNIVGSITKGIADASKKVSKAGNTFKIPITAICKGVTWSERAIHLVKIGNVTVDYIDNVDKELTKNMSKCDSKQNPQDYNSEMKSYDTYEMKAIDQIKSQLNEHVGQIVTQNIVKPIINQQAHRLVGYIGEKIKDGYNYYKESKYFDEFSELKKQYEEDIRRNQNQDTPFLNSIKEKYAKNMLILLAKTKSPKLFATIMRENIPMNMLCVEACSKILPNLLGLSGINILVMGDNNKSQIFSHGEGGPTISLQLIDGHFSLIGNENSSSGDGRNNCLFEAIKSGLPSLNMTSDTFRHEIVNFFEKHMQDDIRAGYHKFSMSIGLFGGARKDTVSISCDELFRRIQNGTVLFSQSSIGFKTRDGMSILQLSELIRTEGWKGEISAVIIGEGKEQRIIVLDHRRTVAAALAGATGSRNVIKVAAYGNEDEFSSESDQEVFPKSKQYKETKAGPAVQTRMRRGSLTGYEGFGFPSDQVRIRLTEQLEPNTFSNLKNMRFIVGGKSRSNNYNTQFKRPRSKSEQQKKSQ